jgi:hypothetical protein
MEGMFSYTQAAMERTMKVQEVILRALANTSLAELRISPYVLGEGVQKQLIYFVQRCLSALRSHGCGDDHIVPYKVYSPARPSRLVERSSVVELADWCLGPIADVLRKEDGVALLRKRLLYQFAINRGIICDQNLQSAGSGIHSWASLFACDSC